MSFTHEWLTHALNHNNETGAFIWLISINGRVPAGSVAGCLNMDGYVVINIKGKQYKAHRLAWFYHYGVWPTGQIDHINGLRDDNRIENLRDVTARENSSNRIKNREGHIVGTTYHAPSGTWMSAIQIEGKSMYLGSFDTPQKAGRTYQNALRCYNNVKDPEPDDDKIK